MSDNYVSLNVKIPPGMVERIDALEAHVLKGASWATPSRSAVVRAILEKGLAVLEEQAKSEGEAK